MYNRLMVTPATVDPRSNTGSNSQLSPIAYSGVESRIDALTILWTFDSSCLVDVHIRDFLDIHLDMVDSIGRKIGVWWDYNHSSPSGSLYSLRKCDGGRIDCRLAISGEDCARLGNARIRGFMLWANKNLLNLKCSRLDLAVDDYGKELDFNQLKNAIESHSYSGFRKSRTVMNHGGKYTGWTVYLGARESEFMVRIYDKFAESKGAIDSIRWEAEIKGEMANNLFPVLLECPGNEAMYQAKLIKYAIGGISFIQKVSKNIGRCPLLDWWENWLKYLSCSPLRIFVKRVKTTLSNTKSWIYRSVAKSLAMLEEGLGVYYFEHFVNELLLDGKSRLTNLDKLRIEDYQTYTHVC